MKKILAFFLTFSLSLTLQLHAQCPSIDIETLMADINADSLHQTVLDLQNFGNRYALREGGNQNVAEYVAGRLNAYGIPAIVDTFHESGNHWIGGPYDQLFYNVKGIMAPSAQADDSLVLIGAHLDAIAMDPGMNLLSYTPGADDNASGVAVMLEMARICHLHGLQFSRPVHFMAYDGEELGLFGSVHDAWMRQDAGEKIAVMLNNDMVSYQPTDDWRLTLHWYSNALDIVARAAEICTQYTDIEPYIPTAADNDDASRSDSYAYYQQGFRAVFAIENIFSTSYHTDHDVADSNNYDYLAHVAKYNLAMLLEYANAATVSVDDIVVVPQLHAYPNPVSDRMMLQYQLAESSNVEVFVSDLTGRTLLYQTEGSQSAGSHFAEVDLAQLPAGMYLCRLHTVTGSATVKVVKQ